MRSVNVFFNKTINLNLTFLICVLTIAGSYAQGGLLIYPKRLVFDEGKRIEKVILSNTGEKTTTYSLSFNQYRMNEFGQFVEIIEPDVGQNFATPFLKLFPRKVTLEPGESQTVKVQVRRTSTMKDGEYRSHLYFRAENDDSPLGERRKKNNSAGISVKIKARLGISIATIIKKGASTTVSSITDLNYLKDENSNHILNFTINRSGNMSTYGDITVNYISKENKSYQVANIKGVAVYTPGSLRRIKMLINKPKNVDFRNGVFKVVYAKNESTSVLSEAVLKL